MRARESQREGVCVPHVCLYVCVCVCVCVCEKGGDEGGYASERDMKRGQSRPAPLRAACRLSGVGQGAAACRVPCLSPDAREVPWGFHKNWTGHLVGAQVLHKIKSTNLRSQIQCHSHSLGGGSVKVYLRSAEVL